jgi:hypothetical protein
MKLFDEIGLKLGINPKDPKAWAKVRKPDFENRGGGAILRFHDGSLLKAFQFVFPEIDWRKERKMKKKPYYFWKSMENQKNFLLKMAETLQFPVGDLSPWYRVIGKDIIRLGGKSLLLEYNSSIPKMLREVFPEHEWDLNRFLKRPQNFWKSREVQRSTMKEIGHKLGIPETDMSFWYKVSYEEVVKNGGKGVLSNYKNSLSNALVAIFPEYPWNSFKFVHKAHNFWSSTENQRMVLNDLGRNKFGIQEGDYDRWYKVSYEDIIKLGGGTLLQQHFNSVALMLMSLIPEYPWDVSKFAKRPRKHWSSRENVKAFLSELAKKLKIDDGNLEGWYKVSWSDFIKNDGAGLLSTYATMGEVFHFAFPDHNWELWRFPRSQKHHAMEEILESIASKLTVDKLEDWYRVTGPQIAELGHFSFIKSKGGLKDVLRKTYPDHEWRDDLFLKSNRKRSHKQAK